MESDEFVGELGKLECGKIEFWEQASAWEEIVGNECVESKIVSA